MFLSTFSFHLCSNLTLLTRFINSFAGVATVAFLGKAYSLPSYSQTHTAGNAGADVVFTSQGELVRPKDKRFMDKLDPPSLSAAESKKQTFIKRSVARKAIDDFVRDGMHVGMGTGSTCYFAVEELGRKIRHNQLKNIKVVPGSVEVKKHCIAVGIPVSALSFASGQLDVMIDGADEIDKTMALIKGGSGSFLREKMMEGQSQEVVIIADETKLVKALGPRYPLPVEVVCWDYERTIRAMEALPSLTGCRGILRRGNINSPVPDGEYPAITDNGNFIVDLYFKKDIPDVAAASAELDGLSGVVEHGLFAGYATTILIATEDGKVRILGHYPLDPSKAEQPWWSDMPSARPLARESVDNRTPTDSAAVPDLDDVLESQPVEPYAGYAEYREFQDHKSSGM